MLAPNKRRVPEAVPAPWLRPVVVRRAIGSLATTGGRYFDMLQAIQPNISMFFLECWWAGQSRSVRMTPWALVIAAVAGAIVGDGFSFWLGHNYRRQILRGWPLNRFPWVVDRSAQLIRKYGIASVFLARFTAVVRAFVPLLAGVLKMSTGHFYVANILSALVWAAMHDQT
jgi:membrane protein DedA with SNARE-associated domain